MNNIRSLGVPEWRGTREDWESTIVDGSLFFVSGRMPVFDAGIKFITKSPLTHTGMTFRCPITGKQLVLEAQLNVGIAIRTLDYYNTEPTIIATHKDFQHSMFPKMLLAGQNVLGEAYDTWEIGKILLHAVDHKFIVHPDMKHEICSELVAHLLSSVSLPLDPTTGGNTPASIFADSHMVHQSLFMPR